MKRKTGITASHHKKLKSGNGKKIILAAVLLIVIAGIAGTIHFNTPNANQPGKSDVATADTLKPLKPEIGVKKSPVNAAEEAALDEKDIQPKGKPMSEPEIKKKYGKLEIIHLYNGKQYIGAVDSYGDVYTFITKTGTVDIPLNEVKMIEIIR